MSGLWRRLRGRMRELFGPSPLPCPPVPPVLCQVSRAGGPPGLEPAMTRDSGPVHGETSRYAREALSAGSAEGDSPQVFVLMALGALARSACPRRPGVPLPRPMPGARRRVPAWKGRSRCRNNCSARQVMPAELAARTVPARPLAAKPLAARRPVPAVALAGLVSTWAQPLLRSQMA